MAIVPSSQSQAFYDFSRNVKEFIESVVGHDRVYVAMTNFPRPNQQYVTYRIIKSVPMDRGTFQRLDNDGNSIYKLNYRVDVEIQCYKEFFHSDSGEFILPNDVVSTIMQRIENKGVAYKFFWQNRAGHWRNGDVDDRSVPLDAVNWEQRARGVMQFHMQIEDIRPGPFDQDVDGFIQTVIFDTVGTEGTTEIRCDNEVVSYPERDPSDPIDPPPDHSNLP